MRFATAGYGGTGSGGVASDVVERGGYGSGEHEREPFLPASLESSHQLFAIRRSWPSHVM